MPGSYVDDVIVAMLLRPTGETGVQSHVQTFVARRRALGRSTRVITPFTPPKALTYPAFAVRRLVEPFSTSLSVWWHREVHAAFLTCALWRTLRAGEPTVIYAQDPVSAAAALRARRNPDQKVVMALHFNLSQADEWADKGLVKRNGRYFSRIRRFEARTLPRLDGLMCVSQFSFDEIVRRIPELAHVRSRIIVNGVADPGPTSVDTVVTPLRLITIGSLEPRKNHRLAVEVIAAAREAGTKLHLTIVGDGPERGALESLSERLGVTDLVTLAGFRRSAAQLIPGFDAYIHTAAMENFPVVLIEAMSYGVPVFSTRVGGVGEAFTDGVEGWFIPDDARAAARILSDALLDRHRRSQMSAAARRAFLQRFEATIVVGQLDQFLSDVAEAGETSSAAASNRDRSDG